MINTQLSHRLSPISVYVKETGEGGAFIVASVKSAYDAREAASLSYSQIAEVLSERRMASVHERIFGSLSVEHDVISARSQAFTSSGISPENPVTYIEGNPPWGEGLAGVIIHAVKKDEVWTVMDRGVPCGRGWKLNGETHLVLQNIKALGGSFRADTKKSKSNSTLPSFPDLIGESTTALDARLQAAGMTNNVAACTLTNELTRLSKPLQARLMLEHAERILRENGASYKDVVRTWFYLSDILGWYAGFNKVRNEKYGEFGIMPGPGDRELLLPASTGISGNSRACAACAMDLIAVLGSDGVAPSVRKLSNPSQLDAFRYGSAFARASVVSNGSTELIELSGTAAIDEHGVSLYPADIRAQIDCTLNKVQTLLAQEGAELKDICSATVFVKHGEHAEIFREMAASRGLDDFPYVCVVGDVCREELLFEIDAEAIVKTSGKGRS